MKPCSHMHCTHMHYPGCLMTEGRLLISAVTLWLSVQATLKAGQEAMMRQAEAMRQVTSERDMLRLRLVQQTQPLSRSQTASPDGDSWIAAAYGTDSRSVRPLSGKQKPPTSRIVSPLRHLWSHYRCWVISGSMVLQSLIWHIVLGQKLMFRCYVSSISGTV